MTFKTNLLAGVRMTAMEQRAGRYLRAPDGHPDTPPPSPAPAPDFSDAFAAASAGGGALPDPAPANPPPADPPAADPPPADPPAADPAAPPAADPPPADPAAPPAADPNAAPPASPTPDAPDPNAAPADPSKDDVFKQLADAIREGQQKPADTPAPDAPAPAEQPVYSAEEIQLLKDYEKDWPQIAEAELLRRRAEYTDLAKFIFTDIVKYVSPLFEQMKVVGNHVHMAELKQALPEYDPQIEDKVSEWVDTQPAYLQEPYKQVMKSGTSDEVADLIRRYWKDTGSAPEAPQPAATPAAAPGTPAPASAPNTELSDAAKKAVEALAPVGSDRTDVPQGQDPNDFGSAFAKYSAELMPKPS